MPRLMKLVSAAAAAFMLIACAQMQETMPKIGSSIGNVGKSIQQTFSGDSCKTPTIGKDTKGVSTWPRDCKNISELDLGVARMLYYFVREGAADAPSPTLESQVVAHYEGRRYTDGVIIDSSYERGEPATFALRDVIPGWGAILQTMRVGDEVVVYIPAALAYGDTQRGEAIPPNTDLVFRIALRDIIGPRKVAEIAEPEPAEAPAPVERSVAEAVLSGPAPTAWAANLPWKPTGASTTRTGTGLSYVVIKSGDASGPSPTRDSTVRVHYDGRLARTGQRFDSSWERGEPAEFPVGRVIPGWTEVLQLMQPGDRWLVHIPPVLAYGEKGTPDGAIGPGEELMFEIHLLDVLN